MVAQAVLVMGVSVRQATFHQTAVDVTQLTSIATDLIADVSHNNLLAAITIILCS